LEAEFASSGGEWEKEERGEGVEVEQVITFFEAWKT
jgi:hypothetical protein